MSILEILIAPDYRLNICSEEVKLEEINDSLRSTLNDMLETMYHSRGVGLAAVQVGIHKRMLVIEIKPTDNFDEEEDIYDKSKPEYINNGGPFFIINPQIIESSEEQISLNEGCLSVPDQRGALIRPKFITLKYLNEFGDEKILQAQGWLGRCILHEFDHLNGMLYISRLSKMKFDLAIKKAKKIKNIIQGNRQ